MVCRPVFKAVPQIMKFDATDRVTFFISIVGISSPAEIISVAYFAEKQCYFMLAEII